MQAPGRQQTSLEKLSGQQMGASVSLSKDSAITNTSRAFLVALVLMQMGGWINFVPSAFPGSCPLLMCSSFSNPRALYLLRRGTLGEGGRFFLLPRAETRARFPSSHELIVSVSSRLNSGLPSPCTALRQGCCSAWDSAQYHVSNLPLTFPDTVLPVQLLL